MDRSSEPAWWSTAACSARRCSSNAAPAVSSSSVAASRSAQLPMLGMRDRDVLADRADGRVEDVVLDVLVDLELGGEGAHQVASLRVLARGRLDRLEQPADQ